MRNITVVKLTLIFLIMSLCGCVVVPAHYGYGGGPYYYVSPPPVLFSVNYGPYWGYHHWRRW